MPNIVKHVGQLNKVYDPSNNKTYERSEFLFIKYGEQIVFAQPVYDDIHFLYQRHMPLTEDDIIKRFGGVLPPDMRGPNIMCTCGAEGVFMLEGPYKNLLMCKAVNMFGKHQTSFKIKDGKIILDKKTADERLMTDAEIGRTMISEEEKRFRGI